MKNKRRPKGLGAIYKLSDDRRKPYIARIQTGVHPVTGKEIKHTVGTYSTYNEAELGLLDYFLLTLDLMPDIIKRKKDIREKYAKYIFDMQLQGIIDQDIRKAKNLESINELFLSQLTRDNSIKIIQTESGFYFEQEEIPTFGKIWEIIWNTKITKKSKCTQNTYKTAYNHLTKFSDIKINLLKLGDIEELFSKLKNLAVSSQSVIKIVLNYIFEYAFNHEYINRNFISAISFESNVAVKKKKPFSCSDIKKFSANDNDVIVKSILIMIYTGLRPIEFLNIEKKNLHLDERYMIGGTKTKSGTNRIIPIHECIVEYIEYFLKNSKDDFVFGLNGFHTTYVNYLKCCFNRIKKEYGFEQTPHCCRHTFATLADEYKLSDLPVKRIMGHSSNDLTKDVYTHVAIQRLIDEVNKIPYPENIC